MIAMKDKFIPLSVPNLKGNELKYITNAVETEWVSTGGMYVNDFETQISDYVKVKGAVSCQSGTSGLHVAMLVAGVTKEDAVIVPALTFIAAVNPVKYIGAEAIFMDCDDSLCMDAEKLKEFCEKECRFEKNKLIHKDTGKCVKALVVVHVFGNMADMESILKTATQYNIKLIEDATEAIGTYYKEGMLAGKYAGAIGDLGVYSFNGNKIITTGGGGMIVSNDEDYLGHARHLTTQAKSDELYYVHDEIGYNYRMTNISAALGIAQLEQLEEFIKTKTKNYELYSKEIETIDGLELLKFRSDIRSNCWFYGINCENFKADRDKIIQYLSENKIQARPIWGLINEQLPYQGSVTYNIEKAYYYWNNIVNIPCSTNLKTEDVKKVITVLKHLA